MKSKILAWFGNWMLQGPFKFNHWAYEHKHSKHIKLEYGLENDGSDGMFVPRRDTK